MDHRVDLIDQLGVLNNGIRDANLLCYFHKNYNECYNLDHCGYALGLVALLRIRIGKVCMFKCFAALIGLLGHGTCFLYYLVGLLGHLNKNFS